MFHVSPNLYVLEQTTARKIRSGEVNMASYDDIPDFDSLPTVDGLPQGCTWGLFDKNGEKDHLGCINLLTPKVVQEAQKEARDGVSISLNWSICALGKGFFGRKSFDHHVVDLKESPLGIHGFDDEVSFNTQASSQWDSFCHFAHQPTGLFYNGVKPTVTSLTQGFRKGDIRKELPTINHWHDRGGLLGRGVLLDYKSYARAQGIEYSCFDNHAISVDVLEKVATFQGTKFKFGDVLLIRTGYTEDLSGLSLAEQERLLGAHKAVGLDTSKTSAKWIWNQHFSAVACDTVGFEVYPPNFPEGETLSTLRISSFPMPELAD